MAVKQKAVNPHSNRSARSGYFNSSDEAVVRPSGIVLPVDAVSIDAIMSDRFRLQHAPTLAAPSLSAMPIAFTRLRCETDEHGLAGPVPPEGSYAFQMMLKPVQSWELRTNRTRGKLPPSRPGDTFLFDLSENPQLDLHSAFDMMRFYIPRSTLDTLSYGRGLRRVAGLRSPPVGTNDPVLYGMAQTMLASMKDIAGAEPMFVEYMALAFHAHVVHTYGAVPLPSADHGLAPWQMRRVLEIVEADPGAPHTIGGLAQECDLSTSHFARAFKKTNGLAPHQWLMRKRIEHGCGLMTQTNLELSEIAIACGFTDQSHFSRVFSRLEKRSPGKWRRRFDP